MPQKQLGQTADSTGDTATTIYTHPGGGVETINIILTCCNVTAVDDDVRVYQDDDGTTATIATAIYYDFPVAANATTQLNVGSMSTASGTIRVSSSTADAITFTANGTERIL